MKNLLLRFIFPVLIATVTVVHAGCAIDPDKTALAEEAIAKDPVYWDPPDCIPKCSGKTCGAPDGCNGTCWRGSCPAGETCGGGGTRNVCAPPPPPPAVCSDPFNSCGTQTCFDLRNDPNHCGACGSVCPFGCLQGKCTSVIYQNGPVIPNADIISVYLGTPDPAFADAMDHFYSEIQRDGRYLQWLSEYSTPTQTIGSGTFAGRFVIPAPGGVMDQAGIGAYLDHEIHIGALPNTSVNTIYMVHVAPSVNVVSGAAVLGIPIGASPGHGWCAMHVSYLSPWTGRGFWRPAIVYAILPNTPSCGQSVDDQTLTASHELIEAITNPMSAFFSEGFFSYALGQGPWAWTDPTRSGFLNPSEIADLCDIKSTLVTSPVDTFTVSEGFSNSRRGCFAP